MSKHGTTLTVALKKLDDSAVQRIKGYLEARRTSIDSFVEDTLTNYLTSTDAAFEDVLRCPNCFLKSGADVPLKGMPMLEAEKKGFIRLGSDESREFAQEHGTYFVVCLDCLWWGFPDLGQNLPGDMG